METDTGDLEGLTPATGETELFLDLSALEGITEFDGNGSCAESGGKAIRRQEKTSFGMGPMLSSALAPSLSGTCGADSAASDAEVRELLGSLASSVGVTGCRRVLNSSATSA